MIIQVQVFEDMNEWANERYAHHEQQGGDLESTFAAVTYNNKKYGIWLSTTGHFAVRSLPEWKVEYYGATNPQDALDNIKFFLDTEVRAS